MCCVDGKNTTITNSQRGVPMGERLSGDRTVLQRYMRTKGIQVNALAAELGVDRTYLSTIVNGWATRSAMQRWAPRIAEALGEPVATLFPRPEKKRPKGNGGGR